jgi:hypothetical protein
MVNLGLLRFSTYVLGCLQGKNRLLVLADAAGHKYTVCLKKNYR